MTIDPSKLTTGGFFALFARKGLEKVQISEDADDDAKAVFNHLKSSALDSLDKAIPRAEIDAGDSIDSADDCEPVEAVNVEVIDVKDN